MRLPHLPCLVLEHERACAVEDPRLGLGEAGRVTAGRDSLAPRFNPDHRDGGVPEEGVEETDRVAAPAHTGHEAVRSVGYGWGPSTEPRR